MHVHLSRLTLVAACHSRVDQDASWVTIEILTESQEYRSRLNCRCLWYSVYTWSHDPKVPGHWNTIFGSRMGVCFTCWGFSGIGGRNFEILNSQIFKSINAKFCACPQTKTTLLTPDNGWWGYTAWTEMKDELRANTRNLIFRNSLRWPFQIINPVDQTKLSLNKEDLTLLLVTCAFNFSPDYYIREYILWISDWCFKVAQGSHGNCEQWNRQEPWHYC